MIISLEGLEGCGKTTQVPLLARRLEAKGIMVACVREPGGTEIGEEIRHIFKKPRSKPTSLVTEFLLANASRAQLYHEVIAPAISVGKWVVCDRFIDSTIAYQGYGRKFLTGNVVNQEFFWRVLNMSCPLKPDVTFVLKLSEAQAKQRMQGREKDKFDYEAEEFYKRVSAGFDFVATQKRATVIDASGTIEEVTERLLSHLQPHIDLVCN